MEEKKLISVSDLVSYLYCPRKLYLKKVLKISEPLNKQMIIGRIRHEVLDLFSKKEPEIFKSVKEPLLKYELQAIYEEIIKQLSLQVFKENNKSLLRFNIDRAELMSSLFSYVRNEINIRTESAFKSISQGFLGEEIWEHVTPKYLTEYKVESKNLGLTGRIDRIEVNNDTLIPFEVKTRDQIFKSDLIQLTAYAMLLEEEIHKKVEKGYVECSLSREEVKITDDLRNEVFDLIRIINNMDKLPPIQSSFNKCIVCSLRLECERQDSSKIEKPKVF